MGASDHTKHFDGLNTAAPPVRVVNSVSRHIRVGDRSFAQMICQAGKGGTDSEQNLQRDVDWWANQLLQRWQVQSGWLRGQTQGNAYGDYSVETAPGGVTDDSPGGSLIDGTTLVNSFVLPRLEATVAGFPVVVEYTNTTTSGYNLVGLDPPTVYDGTVDTQKRTDFVWLEVWLSLVAPSLAATTVLEVVDAAQIVAGDTIDIGTLPALTAVSGPRSPGADDFQVTPGDNATTAVSIAAAINDALNSFATTVTATAVLNQVQIRAASPGSAGNSLTLGTTLTNVGSITPAGPVFLTGGTDRPNKPNQTQLYRHGNVLSPSGTWLDDDIIDPTLNFETAQRVQVQYRIRSFPSSAAAGGALFKTNPDGFSGSPNLTAQAGLASPVVGYPFVPADNNKVWLNSDATAYEKVDSGLWVAGNGSEAASQDLGTLDGFVYAIPLCFVFRHNDCSDAGAAIQGFDPVNNTNGAPMHDHPGYSGVIDTIPAGLSDRPEGAFADVVTQNSLLDLRRHVMFSGADLGGELQHQLQALLDGTTRTWAIDMADKQVLGSGSGDVSTRPLVCNEVGRLPSDGGVAPKSGVTNRGVPIRSFDHIARRFGDQSVVERVVFSFYPGDRMGGAVLPGTNNLGKYVTKTGPASVPESWYEGDVLHVDLSKLDASTLGGLFQGLDGGGTSYGGANHLSDFAPDNMVITDVLSMYHDDGNYFASVDQVAKPTTIVGLGTNHVEITLDANDTVVTGGLPAPPPPTVRMVGSGGAAEGSVRRIFVELEITYPVAEGLTDTPDWEITPDATVYDGSAGNGPGPVIEVDTGQRPADFEELLAPRFREGYREVHLEYVANDTVAHGAPNPGVPVGQTNPETLVSRDSQTLVFPRRVYGTGTGPLAGATSVTDLTDSLPRTVDDPHTDFGSSSRRVALDPGGPNGLLSGAGQTLCGIEYFPQDPVPNYGADGAGYQVGVYYRTNAPQTAGTKEGVIDTTGNGTMPQTLILEPLLVGTDVWTGQVASGSVDLSFPYANPMDQVPINDGPVGSTGEWYFTATASATIDDFNADTGLLTLQALVQAESQGTLQLGGPGPAEVPRKDLEFRSYYPFADDSTYRPTVMGQPLYGAVRHKVFVPMLARATEDAPNAVDGLLYRKNEMLLVVLARFAELDEENTIRFVDVNNRTCAAVYRTKNLLLVAGR